MRSVAHLQLKNLTYSGDPTPKMKLIYSLLRKCTFLTIYGDILEIARRSIKGAATHSMRNVELDDLQTTEEEGNNRNDRDLFY
jgi:hypothetical protein